MNFFVVIVEHFCCGTWRSWPIDFMSIHIAKKIMLHNFEKHWLSNYLGIGCGKKLRSVPPLNITDVSFFELLIMRCNDYNGDVVDI